ncbi:seipin, partial [Phenoliferia sp. Uapishka_3]
MVVSGQAYDVKLDMTVPSSTRNVELGNFMVHLLLVDSYGSPTLNVSRPSTLRYTSPLSQTLSTLSPLSLLSLRSSDVQRMSVPLAEDFILRNSRKPIRVELEMGRKDAHASGWKRGDVGEVQVYDAKLRFQARMKGLSFILYRFPILSFLLFIPTFLSLEFLSGLIVWAIFFHKATSPSTDSDHNLNESSPPSEAGDAKVKLEELSSEEDLGRPIGYGLRTGVGRGRMEGEAERAEEEAEDDEDERMTQR